MPLDRDQRTTLYAALLAAFPSRGALRKMMLLQLGENLDTIALGANLSEDIIGLIVWAQARGKSAELLTGARADNPGNEELRAFAQALEMASVAQAGSAGYLLDNPIIRAQQEVLLRLLEQLLRQDSPTKLGSNLDAISTVQVGVRNAIGQLESLSQDIPQFAAGLDAIVEELNGGLVALYQTLALVERAGTKRGSPFYQRILVSGVFLTTAIRAFHAALPAGL